MICKTCEHDARMERGADVFQTWFNGRDKLDKMLLGKLHSIQNKKIKLLKRC